MYNDMDPELLRLAQEQMSRIPPEELVKIQEQMMSNPELLRFATESMKNIKPEDMRRAVEQMNDSRTEDVVKLTEKLVNATPEDIASVKSYTDARFLYELNAAKMLKQKGNELHSQGQYHEAAKEYLLAKGNLRGIPSSMGGNLQLQCSLNLMSCYLKTKKFDECIKEGSEVLACDSGNVKAFYRRGQAYKELGNLEAAVTDLRKAHEISPDDRTIADVLRDANEELVKESGDRNVRKGLVIEEIVEENEGMSSGSHTNSPAEYFVTQPIEVVKSSQDVNQSYPNISADEFLHRFGDNPETIRLFQKHISSADPSALEALGLQGISPDTIKSAIDTFSKMNPGELKKLFLTAASFKAKGPSDSMFGSKLPEMSPEMINMASETIRKMSPEEFQKMLEVGSSLNVNGTSTPMATTHSSAHPSENDFQSGTGSSSRIHYDTGENNFDDALFCSRMGQSSSSVPTSMTDMQSNMQNMMKDPAMRQMFATTMKNMSPEMIENMSKQFGMNLSKEDAAKAQQTMSQLSPEDFDRVIRWLERARRGIESAKKTKNWLLGSPGMILTIVMLILAFILHQLGFIG